MAISAELLKQINENGFKPFLAKVNEKSEKYYPSDINRSRIVKWLQTHIGGPENWIHMDIWMTAFGYLDAEDAFEKRPIPVVKSREEIERELHARDRYAGSDAARSRTQVSGEKTAA